MKGCTCLEVFGEDPNCPLHGVDAVVKRLRDLAAGKHADVSAADEAADLIEWLSDRPTAALAKAWMPIESAPRDRAVLVAAYIVPSAEAQRNGLQPAWHIDVGRAFGTNLDRWTNVLGEKPSRWMPLPSPPSKEGE